MYTIKFADGTKLDGLKASGNNFISSSPVTPETFRGRLDNVKIECSDTDTEGLCGEFEHMELVMCRKYENVRGLEDGYYFILRQLSNQDYINALNQGNIDYIAMMTGVEL